jgi:hypothetical protein
LTLPSAPEKIITLKKRLLQGYLDGRITDDDYQPANTEYASKIAEYECQLRELADIGASTEAFVSFAELQLNDLSGLWKMADDEQRRRVQTILFRDGLAYSSEAKSLNPDNSTLFSVLEQMNTGNLRLASPTGFEPVLPP